MMFVYWTMKVYLIAW